MYMYMYMYVNICLQATAIESLIMQYMEVLRKAHEFSDVERL